MSIAASKGLGYTIEHNLKIAIVTVFCLILIRWCV